MDRAGPRVRVSPKYRYSGWSFGCGGRSDRRFGFPSEVLLGSLFGNEAESRLIAFPVIRARRRNRSAEWGSRCVVYAGAVRMEWQW